MLEPKRWLVIVPQKIVEKSYPSASNFNFV